MKSALKKWSARIENFEEGYNHINNIVRKTYL